jgi:hypothetical protein
MAATSAHIGFIVQEFRTVTSGPDSGVVTKYGSMARSTDEPLETFFHSVADAQAICDERHNLLKADRRRFQQTISGEAFGNALTYETTMPCVTVIDTERAANFTAIVAEISIDYESGRTSVMTWG